MVLMRLGAASFDCNPFPFRNEQRCATIGKVGMVVIVIQLILLAGTIFPVEAALKKNFDKSGMRR